MYTKPTHRNIAVSLIQQWKKVCQVAGERTKATLTQKEKSLKENCNFEYKPRIDDENKTNLQQHKYLESGSKKPKKIPRELVDWVTQAHFHTCV